MHATVILLYCKSIYSSPNARENWPMTKEIYFQVFFRLVGVADRGGMTQQKG